MPGKAKDMIIIFMIDKSKDIVMMIFIHGKGRGYNDDIDVWQGRRIVW